MLFSIVGRESTLANLGNDRRFISKEYTFISMRAFEEAQSKTRRAYPQSGQYHILLWRSVIPNKCYLFFGKTSKKFILEPGLF